MKIRALDFVVYEVSDMERSVAFYRDRLGLEIEELVESFPWAEFQVPPTTLALYCPVAFENRPPRVGGASIALAVDDVRKAVEELREQGVSVSFEPMETPVCWMAFVKDPDGNQIGLHQRKDGTCG